MPRSLILKCKQQSIKKIDFIKALVIVAWKLLGMLELLVGLFWAIMQACMPDEACDGWNVALKWQMEVTSY